MTEYQQGQIVSVVAYRGEILTRRVWRDAGRGVLLCSEDEYQRALKEQREPLYAGFPKEDVVVSADEAIP